MAVLRKEAFDLPEGVIYLDGNSLGPLPRGATARAMSVLQKDWGQDLIRAWNTADWMALPAHVGDRIAPLIGAPPGSVAVGDTLSVKVFQALAAALQLRPERRVILSDTGNFPSDLYVADGLVSLLDRGYTVRTTPPEAVAPAITEEVAAVLLTHVDYRTGRLHDMAAITLRAEAAGAAMIWDLAHSTGALPIDLGSAAFAVGCSYKYLNGGPGAPAFLYIRPDLSERITPALQGWLGHAAPFEMTRAYRPAPGVARMRIGTPPVIQLAILDAALDLWDSVDLDALRRASITLSELFIAEVEARCPTLRLASPRDPAARGSQVSFAHPEGYAMVQACIAAGVIGDFRAPDLMRFGFAPLYLDADDVRRAAAILGDVIEREAWRRPEYQTRAKVT